eukprot:1760579-Rhodomonas_salina.2
MARAVVHLPRRLARTHRSAHPAPHLHAPPSSSASSSAAAAAIWAALAAHATCRRLLLAARSRRCSDALPPEQEPRDAADVVCVLVRHPHEEQPLHHTLRPLCPVLAHQRPVRPVACPRTQPR